MQRFGSKWCLPEKNDRFVFSFFSCWTTTRSTISEQWFKGGFESVGGKKRRISRLRTKGIMNCFINKKGSRKYGRSFRRTNRTEVVGSLNDFQLRKWNSRKSLEDWNKQIQAQKDSQETENLHVTVPIFQARWIWWVSRRWSNNSFFYKVTQWK